MEKKMKILIIADEVWNDTIHGNNVLTNWFDGFPADIAEIYCSPGVPQNRCCYRYFQITDAMMLKSFLPGKLAGKAFFIDSQFEQSGEIEPEHKNLYRRLKAITTETVRAAREFVWCTGRYNMPELEKFITEFSPDIIFCPRLATLKLLRLERTVQEICKRPVVAFTGDDEYSLQQIRISPVFWIKRLIKGHIMRQQIPNYALYYCLSSAQAVEYQRIFGIPIKQLFKCGEFSEEKIHCSVNTPIRMVYAGKLYCNRWKTLKRIGEMLALINQDEVHIVLDIYTKDRISQKQKKYLHDGKNIFLQEPVSAEELNKIYKSTDILLHVESFDKKNRLLTRHSFSTKIIDCLASGCAVMAVCWKRHAGYIHLQENEAAITVCNDQELWESLNKIKENPLLVLEYAKKAYQCGAKNHEKENVQSMLMNDLKRVIKEYENSAN